MRNVPLQQNICFQVDVVSEVAFLYTLYEGRRSANLESESPRYGHRKGGFGSCANGQTDEHSSALGPGRFGRPEKRSVSRKRKKVDAGMDCVSEGQNWQFLVAMRG